MILCSPSFLYLSEIVPDDETELRPFDLAARLSYALWSTLPDDELFKLAQSKQLTKPKVLRKQVEGLLEDDRNLTFISGFLDSWLNLRDIGNLPPPRKSMPEYYAENLPVSMKREASEFFRHLLQTNGPVPEFLDAEYTFVDKNLAKLYQLPDWKKMRLADGFQRVDVTDNKRRGGLLGMAGVLTVSANGVDTSPVTRGVWVLENILGITPPAPPDEVPSLDGDVSGAETSAVPGPFVRNWRYIAKIKPVPCVTETLTRLDLRWRRLIRSAEPARTIPSPRHRTSLPKLTRRENCHPVRRSAMCGN